MSEGPNAREAAKIVDRKRGYVVAVLCSAIEATDLPLDAQEDLKFVVREEVNKMADQVAAMLPSIVDESVTMNALFLEGISGKLDALLGVVASGHQLGAPSSG